MPHDDKKLRSLDKNPFSFYIGDVEDCEEYHKNAFIESGYRINVTNFKIAFKSLFQVHNELINTWSHLIGCLIALIIGFFFILKFDQG